MAFQQIDVDHDSDAPAFESPEMSERSLPSYAVENSMTDLGIREYDTDERIDANGDIIGLDEEKDLQSEELEREVDRNLVGWNGPDDPENPMNWSRPRQWVVTLLMSLITVCITFASSVFSTATGATAREFEVSDEVATLGTSLYVAGFGLGPFIWGPTSELFGRKAPLFVGFTIFCIFQVPLAVAQNLQTIMLSRFLAGFFGAAPLAVLGGAMADFWKPIDRGVAITFFCAATFVGPVAGPVAGGFITESSLGWRWIAWITLIMSSSAAVVGLVLIPETYEAKLLRNRAENLRFETKNWALHSKAEEKRVDLKTIITTYMIRPFIMMVREPILTLISIYLALVYGLLYLFLEAYPISFQQERHWSQGIGALPFLAILIGIILGSLLVIIDTKTYFARNFKKHGHVVPETRLPSMMFGAVVLPIGLFWFAWTSNPVISWVPQTIAGIPIGMGIFMIFLQGLNYVIDVYKWNANSALASNIFLRSAAGAGFPLFASGMFHNLGVPWATSLLGFMSLALVPVPFCFYLWGMKIRAMSKYGVE
ncbi:major facilitator superfamily domain-containing protein [Xylogone sp. PMI_703]|nr:major facilitator superfamily domain-containing protein [Xylogone sp. PMI_703]